MPSAIQTWKPSHTVPAPTLPWVKHGRSSNLVVEETRVAVAQFGQGSGGATAVGAARGADVVTGEVAAAPVSRGRSLAVDRLVRVDEDIAEQSSDKISSPQFFSLLVRRRRQCVGRATSYSFYDRISNHGSMCDSILFALGFYVSHDSVVVS